MTADIAMESFRALVLGTVVVYLIAEQRAHTTDANLQGWPMILGGFGLLLFASFLDISDNFPSLNWLVIVGNTPMESFLEKIPGYLGGFLLVALGLVRWMPDVRHLQSEVSARKKAENHLNEQRLYLQSVIDAIPDPIMAINLDYSVRLMNRARANDLQGRSAPSGPLTCHWLAHDCERPCEEDNFVCPLREVQRTQRPATTMHLHHDNDGKPYPVEVVTAPYFDPNGQMTGVIESIRDISERINFKSELKKRDSRLSKLTYSDALTGLPNRQYLCNRLQELLNTEQRIVVLAIDINRFKQINQGFGYSAGNEILRATGSRLETVLHNEDLLARIGGDDFIIVSHRLIHKKHIELFIQEVQHLFSKAYTVAEQTIYLTASIGVALYPGDGEDAETLINHVVAADQDAFTLGGRHVHFFSPQTSELAREQLLLEADLRDAIDQGQLVLHYQPQIDLHTRQIVGAEALVRWHRPKFGLIPPDQFIPLAERSGLIIKLGEWVLKQACLQIRCWLEHHQFAGRIGVNLSALQLEQANITETLMAIVHETNCPTSALELEITESMLLHDPEGIAKILNAWRDKGLSVAMDDFGTGYSSMSQLGYLPIDKLKIDQSFIKDLPHNKNSCAITRAIITLADSLHLQTIAEGIETLEQGEFLRQNSVRYRTGLSLWATGDCGGIYRDA